ncbi:helix-turn-helix transcriptional regulator [Pedobacter sp. N36a]|uniref:helix-turn-helix domain-containing protein n=1 Tax=Pedobacter sp. N36a TaxID=2767996 RepID=UPI001656B0A6|nr:helix-turn-helix transcriptional regulator [Pedobacter sp. N36a]MBC8984406.1 helix-turn-helix transcriptional regulator [Pedobacter sp. N36a]
MQFGNALRIQRVIKGYTQEYMAERLNLSQNSYSKLERGLTSLTVSRLYQIAGILEISVQDILPAEQPGNTEKSDSAANV